MKPETKFLLMKMIKSLGSNQSALRTTIIDMRHQFGVTSSAIKEGSDYLVEHGYMIRKKPTKARGKGCSTEYIFQDKLFDLLRNAETKINNADVIEELLLPDIAKDKKRRFQINQSQRLLLVTMFGLASTSGLLHDISISQLKVLTGMSYTRVKSQLKYLWIHRYIHYCQNGGAVSAWGVKIKSRYNLNLSKFKPTVITILSTEMMTNLTNMTLNYNVNVIDGLISSIGSNEYFLWEAKVEEFALYYLNDHDSDLEQKKAKVRDEIRQYYCEIVKSCHSPKIDIEAKLMQIVNATAMKSQYLAHVIVQRWASTPLMVGRSTIHSIIGYSDTSKKQYLVESFGEMINGDNRASLEQEINEQSDQNFTESV